MTIVGGLWEMKWIAAMAEGAYVVVAPLNPSGPVAIAVNMHTALSTTNSIVLEYRRDDEPARRRAWNWWTRPSPWWTAT